MNWALSIFMMLASIQTIEKEIEEFLYSAPKASIEEARSFLEKPEELSSVEQKKCSGAISPLLELFSAGKSNQKLFLFTSFALPIESWKEYSYFLEKTNGCFVLRGLPENSFSVLSRKILELKKQGVFAEILLDPESFEKYAITAIPTLVLDDGKQYDKISGNIQPSASLSYFANSGHTKKMAKQLLNQLEAR